MKVEYTKCDICGRKLKGSLYNNKVMIDYEKYDICEKCEPAIDEYRTEHAKIRRYYAEKLEKELKQLRIKHKLEKEVKVKIVKNNKKI